MTAYEQDPDVVRWGLNHLFCSIPRGGSPGPFTRYDKDFSSVGYVREGYCEGYYNSVENDEIALSLQEEFSRLAVAELSGFSHRVNENQQSSTLAQDRQESSILAQDIHNQSTLSLDRDASSQRFGAGSFQEEGCNEERYSPCSSPGDKSVECEDTSCLPEISDEYTLDGEVGKRLNQMVSIPHVPKVNGELTTADEEISDHQRLMGRLQLYDLVELTVSGDGNCQFRSLSDQIYRSADHHKFVRDQIVTQLKSYPEMYEGYVPMAYNEYLKKMTKNGEWGDHVTLQAAADTFGVKIFVLTSFKDTCYIEILPYDQKSNRIIFLSFWAEVHYNPIYPMEVFTRDGDEKEKEVVDGLRVGDNGIGQ
ncbi:hypothetical protein OROMI_032178 [Orobanche minor]